MGTLRLTLDSWLDMGSPPADGETPGTSLAEGGIILLHPSLGAGVALSSTSMHMPGTERINDPVLPWSYDVLDPTDAQPTGWGWTATLKAADGHLVAVAPLTAATIAALPQVDGVRVARLEDHVGLSDALATGGLVTPLPGPEGPPGPGVTPETVGPIVADYLTAHPVDVPVTSVNGEIGAVVLDAADVGADPAGTAQGLVDALVIPDPDLTGYVQTTDPRLTDARPPTAHGHAIADVSGLQGALDGKQPAGSYAPASHSHTAGQVSGLATVATTGAYADLTGTPTLGTAAATASTDYAPASHGHPWSGITDKPAVIAAGADTASARAAIDAAPADHSHGVTDLTATGTPDATTFLRGDGTWATPGGGTTDPQPYWSNVWGDGLISVQTPVASPGWLGSLRVLAHLVHPLRGGMVDAMGAHVLTAKPGERIWMALYDTTGPGGTPGALVCESGALDVSTTGEKIGTFPATPLPSGWYWAVTQLDLGAGATTRASVVNRYYSLGFSAPGAVGSEYVLQASFGTFGMPASAASTAWSVTLSGAPHGVFWRYAA